MFDKRKRKEKPKRRSRRTWLLIALLLVLLIGLLIFSSSINNKSAPTIPDDIFNPPDGDPLTGHCEFESKPHIVVKAFEYPYIIGLNDDDVLRLTSHFNFIPWDDGFPYVWGSGRYQVDMVNLRTGSVQAIRESKLYNASYNSPSKRYLLRLTSEENNVRDVIIYDGESQSTVIDTHTPNNNVYWTPEESSVLLFNENAPALAQIFDIDTRTFSDANFPSNLDRVLGWVDETTLIYLTSTGFLYEWDRATGEADMFLEETTLFPSQYRARGTWFSPNLKYHFNWDQWMGGIDSNNNFHLINIYDRDQHHIFPMDMSQKFQFRVEDQYTVFEYDTTPTKLKFYYPESATWVDLDVLRENSMQIAPNGRYISYYPSQDQSDYLIQEVATGKTMKLEEKTTGQWVEIEDQSYVLYSVAVDNGTHIFYLFQPDTLERCKVGTFYSSSINILT